MRVVLNSNPLGLSDTKPTLQLLPDNDEDRLKLGRLVQKYDVWFGKCPGTGEVLHVEIPLKELGK